MKWGRGRHSTWRLHTATSAARNVPCFRSSPTMSNNIEMDNLSQLREITGRARDDNSDERLTSRTMDSPGIQKGEDGSTSLWAWTSAATFVQTFTSILNACLRLQQPALQPFHCV